MARGNLYHALLMFWDMEPLARFVPGGAGARPDHSISGHCEFAISPNSMVAQLSSPSAGLPGNPQDNFSARMPLESLLKCLACLLDRQHAVHEGA
jgi:hypothetical protein